MHGKRGLLLGLLLGLLALRLLEPPVYRGQSDGARPRWQSVAAPFSDDLRGSCNAFLALLGRSLSRQGLVATGGVPLLNPTATEPSNFFYYANHPPGIPLLTAAALRGFGDSEATIRLLALAFSTGTAAMLLLLALRLSGVFAGVVMAALLAAMPLGNYWAAHWNYEVPCMALSFAFLMLVAPARVDRRRLGLALACLALAFLADMIALLAAGAFALEVLVYRRRAWRRAGVVFGAAGLLMVGWWAWKSAQLGRYGRSEDGSVLLHLIQVSFLARDFSWTEWAGAAVRHLGALTGFWPLLGVLLVLPRALRRVPQRHASATWQTLFRTTLLLALLAFVIPARRSLDHPYYALYFLLPVALSVIPLVAGEPARCRSVVMLALCAATFATFEWRRPEPVSDAPSSHLVARELAAKVHEPGAVVAIPAAAPFDLLLLNYYSRTPVVSIASSDEDGSGLRAGILEVLGLARAPIYRANGTRWPGREGIDRLPEPRP